MRKTRRRTVKKSIIDFSSTTNRIESRHHSIFQQQNYECDQISRATMNCRKFNIIVMQEIAQKRISPILTLNPKSLKINPVQERPTEPADVLQLLFGILLLLNGTLDSLSRAELSGCDDCYLPLLLEKMVTPYKRNVLKAKRTV